MCPCSLHLIHCSLNKELFNSYYLFNFLLTQTNKQKPQHPPSEAFIYSVFLPLHTVHPFQCNCRFITIIWGFNECCQMSLRETHELGKQATFSFVPCSLKLYLMKKKIASFLSLTHMTLNICVCNTCKKMLLCVHCCLIPPGSLLTYPSLKYLLILHRRKKNVLNKDSANALSQGGATWLGCHSDL